MATRTNATPEALKQYIVRISPVTHSPVLFDAMSKDNGRLTAIIQNEITEVGLDYYNASSPIEPEVARQVVQAYAEHAHIPVESILVRSRLPKTNPAAPKMRRRTDDANLVLVKSDKKQDDKQESNQDYRSLEEKRKDDLASAAQSLQDEHDSAKGKSTAANPEGAVVKAADKEPRKKRKYQRTPKNERSARSKAAYEQYVKELGKAVEQQPEIMEPVQHDAPQEVQDDAIMQLATALAKILKSGAV